MSWRRLLVLLVLAAAAWPVATASGAASQKKAIWGPPSIGGVSQFPVYKQLGVGILQQTVRWDAVAPTRPVVPTDPADPAYRWPAALDEAVSGAAANGIRISLLVLGSPGWENGRKPWNRTPARPADYADFLQAIAARYPTVHLWMIWGEPTKGSNYQPLVPDHGKPLTGAARKPAQTYATLLDGAYGRLKSLDAKNLVIGGNSFTVGTVQPLYWIQALRLPDGRPPRMDLYGHNPFTLRTPDFKAPPLGGGRADFSDLPDLETSVARNLKRGGHVPRIFISEITLPTDHPNVEFNFWVSDAIQAKWLGIMLRLVRADPRIYTLGYLGLVDDEVRPDGRQVERGLVRRDGSHKPAFAVFAKG